METFKIVLFGKELLVHPLLNGDFEIEDDNGALGILTPIIQDVGVVWACETMDKVKAQQIGELIGEFLS